MRHTLSQRNRTALEQSKNHSIRKNAHTGAALKPTENTSIDLPQIIQLFKEITKFEFTEMGDIQTSSTRQRADYGWTLHHKQVKLDPVTDNPRRFTVTLGDLQLLNKKNIAIPLAGELRFTVSVSEKNIVKIEQAETNNSIVDAMIMGENLGPFLSILKRRFSVNDLTSCENAIKKALLDTQLNSARRLAYSAALAAIEAIHLRPSSADTRYLKHVDKLVFAAWELFHQTPDNLTTALTRYSKLLQDVKHELSDADKMGALNAILRRHEEEISTRLMLSEIDSTLLTDIHTLMAEHRFLNSEEMKGFYLSLEESRLMSEFPGWSTKPETENEAKQHFENDAAFKTPNGFLKIKALCLEGIRKDIESKLDVIRRNLAPSLTLKAVTLALRSANKNGATAYHKTYLELKNKEAFYRKALIPLDAAIHKINQLLYFKPSPGGNPLLQTAAEILPKNPKNTVKTGSLDVVLSQAQIELTRESHEALWLQFLRRWFQPKLYQQAQLKRTLHEIVKAPISLSEKLSKITHATQTCIQHSKLSAWAILSPPDDKAFLKIQAQVKALCIFQAFATAEIGDTALIDTLGNCGFPAAADAFQKKSEANEVEARLYQETLAAQISQVFKEPISSTEMPQEKTPVLQALSTRTQNFAQKAQLVWAERQRTPVTVPVDIVPELDSSPTMVH